MNAIELFQYSLRNAFDILGQVVADLAQEQADWAPPGIANPIGATYWHTVSSVDDIVNRWIRGDEPLHQKGGWSEKVLTIHGEFHDQQTTQKKTFLRLNHG